MPKLVQEPARLFLVGARSLEGTLFDRGSVDNLEEQLHLQRSREQLLGVYENRLLRKDLSLARRA